MTLSDRRRTDPAFRAYTVPVVRGGPDRPRLRAGIFRATPAGAAGRRLECLVTAMRSPIASVDRPRYRIVPAERIPSQRELVAWSLMTCPDDRPSRDRP